MAVDVDHSGPPLSHTLKVWPIIKGHVVDAEPISDYGPDAHRVSASEQNIDHSYDNPLVASGP